VRTPPSDRLVVAAFGGGAAAVVGVGLVLGLDALLEGRVGPAVFTVLVALGSGGLLVTAAWSSHRSRVEIYEEGLRYVRGDARGEIAWRDVTRIERAAAGLEPAVYVVHVGATRHVVPALLSPADLRPLRARGIGLG
jgi:hypothetical protein